MRRDWDFVEFADYAADMDQLSAQASAIIDGQRREIRQLERTIFALVYAAGGQIDIHSGHLYAAEDGELIRDYLTDKDVERFRAKPALSSGGEG